MSIIPGENDGDNDEMKELIEHSKNDFRYLGNPEVIFCYVLLFYANFAFNVLIAGDCTRIV